MQRPCAMAFAMVAKLSSVSTISAAFLATSVPARPMAMPTSADFNEGASLTPSPVIAVICPLFLHAETMRTLCSGETWAKTETPSMRWVSSSSLIPESASPERHSFSLSAMPSSFAMANAVSIRSPVIIMVFTPARRNSATASAASGRTGSAIPAMPRKVRSFSSGTVVFSRMPSARTRRPFPVNFAMTA